MIGLGALTACLGACAKNASSSIMAPANIDFTLDLSQSANATLQINGGYLYSNGIIVARTIAGAYIAVQQYCTHESVSIVYQPNYDRFYCDGHGATFTDNGIVTGGPAPTVLKSYNTSLTGNLLRVYS